MTDPSNKSESSSSCRSPFSVICFICACALIAYIIHQFASRPSALSARRLWLPVVVETNGNETILGDSRQFEFWTPSAKTKDFLHKENGELLPAEKWQGIPNDDAVLQFGEVLHTNRNVLGYRRVEVWGQGRTAFKPGWWWSVNVYSNYSVGEMGRAYQTFWKSSSAVFIEVIDNRGHADGDLSPH